MPVAAPAKVEKKINVELKGTYIKTFEKNKKAYYSNSNFHICYDPYNKRFYTFTWIWDAHTNIFPSLITMTYDPERYQTSPLHHITLTPVKSLTNCTLEDYANKLVEELLMMQKVRFCLPFRLRNWDYLYGWMLTDLQNKKGMLGNSNEEEKKKISAQKAKLQARLGKVNALTDREHKKNPDFKPVLNKNLVEIRKDYAFSMDGSLNTLKIVHNILKAKENLIDQALNDLQFDILMTSGLYPYFNLLSYWVKHSDILLSFKEKEPSEILYIENLLYNILSHDVNSADNFKKYVPLLKFNLLCWRILINGWNIFVRTSQKQFKWIQLILQSTGRYKIVGLREDLKFPAECLNSDGYSPLVYFYLKYAHYPDSVVPEFPLKDHQIQLIKPNDLFDNSDEKGAFNVTRRSQVIKIREDNFVEPYGRLLIEDLSYLQHVKAYSNQFEDLYNSYFINENQEALKINKPKEEKTEKVEEKQKPKGEAEKSKGKKKPTKPAKQEKQEKPKEAPLKTEKEEAPKPKDTKEEDGEKAKGMLINPDLIVAHEESSKRLFETFEKVFYDVVNSPTSENILVWKIFTRLLYDSWNEFEKIEEGEFEWKHKLAYMERIFLFLEKVLDHYSQKFTEILDKHSGIATKIAEYISILVSSLSYLAYQSSITKNFGCEEITYTLIRLYSKLKKFLDFQDDKGQRNNILEYIITQNDEGIDYLNEKIVETNHPYERGRVINFDPLIFPGAIAISIEFDRRCHSDVSHDFISLSSGYDSTYSNIGYFMNHREAIGTSFRISGKPNLKKPLVMLGNCLQADFAPSGQVK